MTKVHTTSVLGYYEKIGAALFPIPAGQKNPTGIVGSFAQDCSRDASLWQRWATEHPGCNWGVVAGPSRLIIVDIDIKEGRDEAWAQYDELCKSWGIPTRSPHVQSARGGWHVYFSVPEGVDAATLRQPDAIKKKINIRAGNGYTVTAGSTFENKPYVLMSEDAPYPAPQALVDHCMRKAAAASTAVVGSRDAGDVIELIKWLNERDAFAAYEDWVGAGMALKLEFGDAGLALWQHCHDSTVTADVIATKWQSFASEPTAGCQTLNSLLANAHKFGWTGNVRRSTAAMFAGAVSQLAQTTGAQLASGGQGMPMTGAQEALARLGKPIVDEFLKNTADQPTRPHSKSYPRLPASMSEHGLYTSLSATIDRIIAMAEMPKTFKPTRVTDSLSVLLLVHRDTFDAVRLRMRALGCALPDAKIKLAAAGLTEQIEREFVAQDHWQYDIKGHIEHNNPDNVAIFLGIIRCELRWNAWLERAEIRGWEWPEWSYVDEAVHAKLSTRAGRTKTRFLPTDTFLWRTLLALAHQNTVDPLLDCIQKLSDEWDGTHRLSVWLSQACGVPCDLYHQEVGRNIIGGMVRRARRPGCKHDTMAVFCGPQGTGKSTMARRLALFDDCFTDSVLLGEASKELVLSLAGKLVVEISEMGMRGSANPAHVKAMISKQTDAGRTAYARSVTERKRRNIFIGTTNDDEPLMDNTGNRRFLPVRVDREIDLEWLNENVKQLVGEAARLESEGHDFALSRSVWIEAAKHQENARSVSPIEELLESWFADQPDDVFIRSAAVIMALSLARQGFSLRSIAPIMRRMGYRPLQGRSPGIGKARCWIKAAHDHLGVCQELVPILSSSGIVEVRKKRGTS